MAVEKKEELESVNDFFKNQIYQQHIQTSAGWTTIFQAMVASASKAMIDEGKNVDMDAIGKLMELSKKMQSDTIGTMKELKSVDD